MRKEVIQRCIEYIDDNLYFSSNAGKLRYVKEFLNQELEAYNKSKVREVNPSWYPKKQV